MADMTICPGCGDPVSMPDRWAGYCTRVCAGADGVTVWDYDDRDPPACPSCGVVPAGRCVCFQEYGA